MHRLYKALTAQPFYSTDGYREIPACVALKPYIRCFWGTEHPKVDQMQDHTTLVVPDTCADLIFSANYTLNTFSASFCGLQDHAFETIPQVHGHCIATFAIRFYPWALHCFASDSLVITRNACLPGEMLFKPLINPIIRRMEDGWHLAGLIACTEQLLLSLFGKRAHTTLLLNAMHDALCHPGRLSVPEIACNSSVSTRQLERIFVQYTGIPPKSMQTLLRYQQVLEEAIFSPRFDVQDMVYKYGYTDQSHLLHEFRRYHTMTPSESRQFALLHR